MLNKDQWESQRAGDWLCTCHNNSRGNRPYAYYWNYEFPRDPEVAEGWNVEALMLGLDRPKRPAPTVSDAIRLIEKIEKCDGMPAKLILLRNFILFVAGRLSDWP
jgi:hypothetical protein